jgi:hypothetical protein
MTAPEVLRAAAAVTLVAVTAFATYKMTVKEYTDFQLTQQPANPEAGYLRGYAGTNAQSMRTYFFINSNGNKYELTMQGNSFNGPGQLVKLPDDGKLPALDGSNLTNLPGGSGATTDASALITGTLDDARLSANVPVMTAGALPAVSGANLTNLPGGASYVTGTDFIGGSVGAPVTDVWFGNGKSSATPTDYMISGTNSTDEAVPGGSVILAGGGATNTGFGGSIIFKTTSSGLQAPVERLRIDQAGGIYTANGGTIFGSSVTAFMGAAGGNPGGQGTVPAPAANDDMAGKFLKASGGWEVPPTPGDFFGDGGGGGSHGLVPAPAAGDAAAGKFLKASGSWEVPSPPQYTVSTQGSQTVVTATPSACPFTWEVYDSDTMHDTVTDNTKVTAIHAGLYLVTCNYAWADGTGGAYRKVALKLNGLAEVSEQRREPPASSNSMMLRSSFSQIVSLNTNEYLEVWADQDSGSDLNMEAKIQVHYVGPYIAPNW